MSWDQIIKGTNGDDVINGGSGDDFLQGRAGGDLLDGGDGDDQLHGDSGDDFLRGGAGNDLLHGGTGTDTAVYSGSMLEYSFSTSGGDYFVNHSGGSMIDGHDRLISIERLVFADGIIDLTRNNAPIARDDTASTDEDAGNYSSGSSSVLDNDFDWENDNLTVVAGTFSGAFGTLVLNSDGTYTYTPYASAQALALGQNVQDSFSYVVTDGSLSDTATLTITIAGRNDAPVAGPDVATTGENMAVSVNVLANDGDVDNGAVLTVTAASAPAGQGSASVAGNQVQFDPGSDFDYLASGESATVLLSYSIADEHGATSTSTAAVTVTGTNDTPTIDSGGTSATGSVGELPNDDPGENLVVHEADGVIAFDDLDLSDTHSATATAQGAGYLGTFTLDPVDQGSDTVAWHFDVSDAALDGLEEGETIVQTYTIAIDDGNGGTVTRDVTVTLIGAGDSAGPPWYIDNSAAESTNAGSASNPFTSIAAFNAAQGTPGGPAAGDQVFLLAGIGTYAEADGINLLDGQILTGIGDPTIAPTAGDGINVGLDNSISGLNIAGDGGDGIAGGDVGALVVSGVDITTTGGVGVGIGSGSGVSISGTTIASGSNYAILATNVDGFSLTDSVVSSGAASAGTASFTNLTGNALFLGNILNGGGGDTLSVANSTGSLTLTIADSASNAAVVGGNDAATGDDAVSITTNGDSSLTLVVDGVDFEGARDDLLEVRANGSSSQNLTITGNNFHNMQDSAAGGGVELGGGGAGSDIAVDYQVEGNSFTGASGTAFSAAYTQQAGTVRGYIAGNVIGIGDGAAGSQGSAGGDGISATLQKTPGAGDATYLVTIVGNEIYDVDGGSGIAVRSSGGGIADAAVMEAIVKDNVVDELGDFALAGLYALVGGASASGDFARLGLVLDGNIFDAGDADFGIDAIFLDQVSSDAHFYVPGYSGSGDGEFSAEAGTASADLTAFWSVNNALVTTPFNIFGGVDASIVSGLTGEPLTQPAFFP